MIIKYAIMTVSLLAMLTGCGQKPKPTTSPGPTQAKVPIIGTVIWERTLDIENALLFNIDTTVPAPASSGKPSEERSAISLSGAIKRRDPSTTNYAFVNSPVSVSLSKNGDVIGAPVLTEGAYYPAPIALTTAVSDIAAERNLKRNPVIKTGQNYMMMAYGMKPYGLPDHTDVHLFWLSPDGKTIRERNLKNSKGMSTLRVTQLNDGGFLLSGVTHRNFSDEQLYVLKLSPDGTTLWERDYADARYRSPNTAVELGNGTVIVAGTSLQRVPVPDGKTGERLTAEGKPFVFDRSPAGKADLFAVSLDLETGAEIWSRRYRRHDESLPLTQGNRHTGEEYLVSALRLTGNRTLLAGTMTGGKDTLTDVYLMAIDKDGVPLLEQRYGGPGIQILQSAAVLPDGHVLLSARTTGDRRFIIGGSNFRNIAYTETTPWLLKISMGSPE